MEPANINILLDLANVYLIFTDFAEARNYAAEALRLEPGNKLAGQVLIKIEEIRKAHDKLRGKGR